MNLKLLSSIILLLLSFSSVQAEENNRLELLKEESKAIIERSLKIASQFYSLEEGQDVKEITQAILESPDTREHIKERIRGSGRRFFLFSYPSDGFLVKGYISFVSNPTEKPLLLFLRGGNGLFGLMHPATIFTCLKDYTVIATAYRGGVSEGIDEFGGSEVNDVHNLMEYLPTLAEKLDLELRPKNLYMLGGSRGGMEMFLALTRSPSLQKQISKAVSLSGLLDLQACMDYRNDMREMFIRNFGLVPGENEESWIAMRNPLNTVPNLRKDLPFLIIQGTEDLRVSLDEGVHMIEKLKEQGCPVDYLEIPGGDHCLANQPNFMDLITDWLEK